MENGRPNIILDKTIKFSLDIIRYCEVLESERKYVIARQLLKSGTSIGANVREAEHAQSKADFIHKLSISLKEANETEYWLDLLYETKYINQIEFENIKPKIIELLKLLTSIINTSKSK